MFIENNYSGVGKYESLTIFLGGILEQPPCQTAFYFILR